MILLTGATGFLGSHVCASLVQRGHAIRACKRENSSLREYENIMFWRLGENWKEKTAAVEWVEADILDYDKLLDAMQGVEAVFHCAAIVSFWKKRREELYQVNIEGTAHVVNAALAAGVPWLIHTSSIAAIGRDAKHPIISEDNEWTESPLNSHYAISKHLAEMEVWRGREEGLKTSMVNPGIVLGEGDWTKGSCRLLKKIMDGLPYYTMGQNGYVDVWDVAEAMILLYEKRIDGQRIILVGENLQAKELISLGSAVFGKPAPSKKIQPWILQIAWRLISLSSIVTGKEPLLTKETATTGSHSYQYSTEKSQSLLGIQYHSVQNIFDRLKALVSK